MSDALLELLKKKEELCPELQEYMVDGWDGRPKSSLKHPLVFSVLYDPVMNAMLNAQLQHKNEALKKARGSKDWHSFVFLHERPYRHEALMEIDLKLTVKEFWEMARFVWMDSENIWQFQIYWENVFVRPNSHLMMTEGEKVALAAMTEMITIYRGYQPRKNKYGLSYTLHEPFALRMATGYGKKGKVWTRQVKKADVVAYLNERGDEQEIIIKPSILKGG